MTQLRGHATVPLPASSTARASSPEARPFAARGSPGRDERALVKVAFFSSVHL